MILTCFVIVVLELLDNKIRDGEYPSNLYGIKTLATIPDVEDDSGDNYGETSGKKRLREKSSWFINKKKKYKNLADVFIPCDKLPFRASEAYKMLRTGILNLKKEETSCDVIGVTSSCPSEGKSTLAIYLSYTFAQQGKKVLLIEGDLRKPVVAKRLKLSPAVGLSDMVLETTEGAIQTSSYLENWKVICAGRTEDNPSEILGSHKMEVLISELRKDFDCIIIDLPPINEVTDSIAVSGCLDGMLFAIKENGTTKMELETAMNHLAFSKAELLGFVITNSSADAKSKYYKKGYYA